MKCTDPVVGNLIGRYELDALEEPWREKFVEHMVECEYCHNEVYSMEPYMRAAREHKEGLLKGPGAREAARIGTIVRAVPLWRRRYPQAAALLLLAIALAVVAFLRPWKPQEMIVRLQDMPIPKASYVPAEGNAVLRSSGSEPLLRQAMTAYQQDDYATASRNLEVISRLDPDSQQAHFYWGIALLMLGRPQDSIAPLKQAMQLSIDSQCEECRFYLAVAFIKCSRVSEAHDELDAVIQMNGQHRAAAEKLRQRLESK